MSYTRVVLPRLAQFGESGLENEAVQKLKANAPGKIVTMGLSRGVRKWGGSSSKLHIGLQDGDIPADGSDDFELTLNVFQDKSVHLPVIEDNAVTVQTPSRPESRGSKTPTIPGVGYWTKRGGKHRPASVLPDLEDLEEDGSPDSSKLDLTLTIEGQADPWLLPKRSSIGTRKINKSPEECLTPSPSISPANLTHTDEEIYASLEEDLKQLLLCQSLGVTIEKKKTKRGVVATPVFHCPRCFKHWSLFGTPVQNCDHPRQPTKGPNIKLSEKSHDILQKFTQLDPPKRVQIISKMKNPEPNGYRLQNDASDESLMLLEGVISDDEILQTSPTDLGSSLIARRASIEVKSQTEHATPAGSLVRLKVKQNRNYRKVERDFNKGEMTEKQGKKPAEDREEIRRKNTKHEKHISKKHSSHGNESLGYTYDEWSSVKGGRISKDTTQIESNHGNNSRLPDGKEIKHKPVGKFEFGSSSNDRPSVGLVGPDGGYYIGEYDEEGNFAPHTRLNNDGSTRPVTMGTNNLYYTHNEGWLDDKSEKDQGKGLRFDYGSHGNSQVSEQRSYYDTAVDMHADPNPSNMQKFSTLQRKIVWTHEISPGDVIHEHNLEDGRPVVHNYDKSERLHENVNRIGQTVLKDRNKIVHDSIVERGEKESTKSVEINEVQEHRLEEEKNIQETKIALNDGVGQKMKAKPISSQIMGQQDEEDMLVTTGNILSDEQSEDKSQSSYMCIDSDERGQETTSGRLFRSADEELDSCTMKGERSVISEQNYLINDSVQNLSDKVPEVESSIILSEISLANPINDSTPTKIQEDVVAGREAAQDKIDSCPEAAAIRADSVSCVALDEDEDIPRNGSEPMEEHDSESKLNQLSQEYDQEQSQVDENLKKGSPPDSLTVSAGLESKEILPEETEPYYDAFASEKHDKLGSARKSAKSGRRGSIDPKGKVKNPAVKNVTGRPDTKAGALRKHMLATPKSLLTQNTTLEVGQSNKTGSRESDKVSEDDKPKDDGNGSGIDKTSDYNEMQNGMRDEEMVEEGEIPAKVGEQPGEETGQDEEETMLTGKGRRKIKRPAKKERMPSTVNRKRAGVVVSSVEGEVREGRKEETIKERNRDQVNESKQENNHPEMINQPEERPNSSSRLQRDSRPRIASGKEITSKSSLSKFSKFALNLNPAKQEGNQASFRMTYSTLPRNFDSEHSSSQTLFDRGVKSPDKLPSLVTREQSPPSAKASRTLPESDLNYMVVDKGYGGSSTPIKSPPSPPMRLRPCTGDSAEREEPIWESVSEMWQKHTTLMGRFSKLDDYSYLPLTQAFTFSFFDVPCHYVEQRSDLRVKGAGIKTLKRPPKMKIKGKKKRPPTAELEKLLEEKKRQSGKQNLVKKLWLMEKRNRRLDQPRPKLRGF
ncbi:uncharacterized protein [Apostichopus japonicus]|uniref:uncharacterized protein n=1 Tax=Stichopus japonicus TaxID=307972 RepID=UPI003AB82374